MATSRVVIVNGTDDDAVCKVSGGSGAPGSMTKDTWKWQLPKRETLSFSIQIGNKTVTPKLKGLRLTKNPKGYQLEVVGNGNDPKPKPKKP